MSVAVGMSNVADIRLFLLLWLSLLQVKFSSSVANLEYYEVIINDNSSDNETVSYTWQYNDFTQCSVSCGIGKYNTVLINTIDNCMGGLLAYYIIYYLH